MDIPLALTGDLVDLELRDTLAGWLPLTTVTLVRRA